MRVMAAVLALATTAGVHAQDPHEVVGERVVHRELIETAVGPDLCRTVDADEPTELGPIQLRLGPRDELLVRGSARRMAPVRNARSSYEPDPSGDPPPADSELRISASTLRRGVHLEVCNGEARAVVAVDRDWRGVVCGPASGWRYRFEEITVTVLDSNLSGAVEPGDHLIYGDRQVASPWHRRIIGPETIHEDLRVLDAATLSVRSLKAPDAGALQATVDSWNAYRRDHGVPPAEFASDRVEACQLHAAYLQSNGVSGHDEDPALPGYSLAGRRAGMSSCITYSGLRDADRRFLRSLYHRSPLIDPRHERLQLGGAGNTWLLGGIDTTGLRRADRMRRGMDGPLVQRFPAPGASFEDGSYRIEHPSHPALEDSAQLGLPVTLRFLEGAVTAPASASLHSVRGKVDRGRLGKPVPCHLSYPGHNVPAGYEHAWQTIALTPLEALDRGAYEARFELEDGSIYRWRFRIGR